MVSNKPFLKMLYSCCLILYIFCIHIGVCRAETTVGGINNTEFVIEKQKKNKINQEIRLFFKAPSLVIQKSNKPLAEIEALTAENFLFDPAPEMYAPFSLEERDSIIPFHHCFRLGIGSLLWLPYAMFSLYDLSALKGNWSASFSFIPELLDKKWREGSFALKGKYRKGSWLLQPNLDYQNQWHVYDKAGLVYNRILHHTNGTIFIQKASEFVAQGGKISYNALMDHRNKLSEKLCMLKYNWIIYWERGSIKASIYNDISHYIIDNRKKTIGICSATPNFYFTLPKNIQLKSSLRIAYHNNPISGVIPNFVLYPMFKVSSAISIWLNPYLSIAGMGGGGKVQPLHLRDLVYKNPFLAKDCALEHSHESFTLKIGSKGVVSSNFFYYWNTVYHQVKNLGRIVSTGESVMYKLLYNRKNHNTLKSTLLVTYTIPSSKFNITTKGTFYYHLKNESNPIWWYNKPSFKLKPTILYMPYPKLFLTGSLDFRSLTTIKDVYATKKQIENLFNITLGVDYFFNKRFASFVMVRNLLDRNNTSYTGYNGKGRNISVGIQYRW